MNTEIKIVTVNTNKDYELKRKISIDEKLLEKLKANNGNRFILILPKNKTIEDLEINKDGSISTRLRDKNGRFSSNAKLINDNNSSIEIIISYIQSFSANLYNSLYNIMKYLSDQNDSEFEQCCDFLYKTSINLNDIIENDIMKNGYYCELIRKKEYIDKNIKFIRKRIEYLIENMNKETADDSINEIFSLSEYMNANIELYSNYLVMERLLLNQLLPYHFDIITNEITTVYTLNNKRLSSSLSEFKKKVDQIANERINDSRFLIMRSWYEGWYNPFIANDFFNNECAKANKLAQNSLQGIRNVDFEKLKNIFIDLRCERKYLIQNDEVYEIRT